ncbi:hypothetical protein XANCAGTX0491_007195 [Xanthoria calcicola]
MPSLNQDPSTLTNDVETPIVLGTPEPGPPHPPSSSRPPPKSVESISCYSCFEEKPDCGFAMTDCQHIICWRCLQQWANECTLSNEPDLAMTRPLTCPQCRAVLNADHVSRQPHAPLELDTRTAAEKRRAAIRSEIEERETASTHRRALQAHALAPKSQFYDSDDYVLIFPRRLSLQYIDMPPEGQPPEGSSDVLRNKPYDRRAEVMKRIRLWHDSEAATALGHIPVPSSFDPRHITIETTIYATVDGAETALVRCDTDVGNLYLWVNLSNTVEVVRQHFWIRLFKRIVRNISAYSPISSIKR